MQLNGDRSTAETGRGAAQNGRRFLCALSRLGGVGPSARFSDGIVPAKTLFRGDLCSGTLCPR